MNLFYDFVTNKIFKNDSVSNKLILYMSNDNAFAQELTYFCHELISSGCLASPVQLFTQHNHDNVIFRADDTGKMTHGMTGQILNGTQMSLYLLKC